MNTSTSTAARQRRACLRSARRSTRTRLALSTGPYHAESSIGEWKLKSKMQPRIQKIGKSEEGNSQLRLK